MMKITKWREEEEKYREIGKKKVDELKTLVFVLIISLNLGR